MVMKVLREGAFGGFLKYFFMSLLALSVLGLVFMDVRGVLTGRSLTGTDVARVGSETIGLREFDKIARLRLRQMNMTPEDVYNQNPAIMDELLGTAIRSRFVKIEADSLGISVGQRTIQEELIKRIKPMQEDDETLQQALERLLRSQGIKEADFVENYEREIVGDILLEASQVGFGTVNDDMARDLFLLQNNKRDLEMIVFPESDITTVEQPEEERLKRLYESYKKTQFKIPELRVFELAAIDDSKLLDTLDISEESLLEQYNERSEEFHVGDQYLLEQVVAPSEEAAKSILTLVRNDKVPLKDAKDRIIGVEGTYIPQAPLGEDMLIEPIRDAVLQAENGDTVGPIKTVMGFHLLHVGETIPSHVRPFEEVKDALRKEMEQVAVADRVYALSNELEDLLAGGNTIEEIKETIPLTITALPAVSAAGLDGEKNDAFANLGDADKSDKDIILEEGFILQPGEVSRVFELPSGRFAALRIEKVIEETYKPYEDVKKKLADDFVSEQQRVENFRLVSNYVKDINGGQKTYEQVAKDSAKKIETLEGLSLSGPMPAVFSNDLRPMIFESYTGDLLTLPVEGGSALVRIKAVHLPEINNKGEENIKRIQAELTKETKDEIFNYYVLRIGEKYPAVVNHALLDMVYKRTTSDGETQ